MSFTHGIRESSDKLKSTNHNQDTLYSKNAMNRGSIKEAISLLN